MEVPTTAAWSPSRVATRRIARTTTLVIQLLLAARVTLLMFAPPATDPAVRLFLGLTQVLIDPFRLVMHVVFIDPFSGSILDTLALTALLGYTLLEHILFWVIAWEHHPAEPLPWLPDLRPWQPIRRPMAVLPAVSLAKVAGTTRPRFG
jgi:hypothetical protein